GRRGEEIPDGRRLQERNGQLLLHALALPPRLQAEAAALSHDHGARPGRHLLAADLELVALQIREEERVGALDLPAKLHALPRGARTGFHRLEEDDLQLRKLDLHRGRRLDRTALAA